MENGVTSIGKGCNGFKCKLFCTGIYIFKCPESLILNVEKVSTEILCVKNNRPIIENLSPRESLQIGPKAERIVEFR